MTPITMQQPDKQETQYHVYRRPLCPIHGVRMIVASTRPTVRHFRCPRPQCRCRKTVLREDAEQ